MPMYMLQYAFNAESWDALTQKPQDRSAVIRALVQRLGGKLHGFYYTFGQYDGVIIYEVPDSQAAAAFSMAITASGVLRAAETTPLMSVNEGMDAMRRAGEAAAAFAVPKK